MLIPLWQRVVGMLIYLLPWSDALPLGRELFIEFPFLQWLVLPALPIVFVEQFIPFGGLLLFLTLFLAVTRNPKVPYFVRFNTLQALLIDIGVILINYAFQIFLDPFGSSLLIRTISSTLLTGVLAIVIFTIVQCLQGKEPDLPAISQAVRIQML